MDIKDLYKYAWTHNTKINPEDPEYLLGFMLDKVKQSPQEVPGLLQRAIDRRRLVDILNMLGVRIYLDHRQFGDPLTPDWLTDNLLDDSNESYRHLQTELDTMLQNPEMFTPEHYNIPTNIIDIVKSS